jgi:hypothetical protein
MCEHQYMTRQAMRLPRRTPAAMTRYKISRHIGIRTGARRG